MFASWLWDGVVIGIVIDVVCIDGRSIVNVFIVENKIPVTWHESSYDNPTGQKGGQSKFGVHDFGCGREYGRNGIKN